MSNPCVICDLDRVLFHTNAWEEYIPEDRYSREGWDKFNSMSHLAVPNYWMFGKVIKYTETCPVFFITSREECIRKETKQQIFDGSAWKIMVDEKLNVNQHKLIMRPYDCYDDDAVLKEALLRKHVFANDFFPLLAIDDNHSVAEMYRSMGIVTWEYDIATEQEEIYNAWRRVY